MSSEGSMTLETAIRLLVAAYRTGLQPPGPLGSWLGENSGLSVLDALEGLLDDYETTFTRIRQGPVSPPGDVAAGTAGRDPGT